MTKRKIQKKTLPVILKKSLKKETPKMQKLESKQKTNVKKNQGQLKKPIKDSTTEVQHHEILQMLIDDHKPLKRLIATMKDSEANMSARKSAFGEFVPLLTIHAKAEENSLYTFERSEIDMRENALEGFVEHAIAEQLIEQIKKTSDKDFWSARVKVLAELVEHHLEEEETEMFPEFKKSTEMEDRVQLGEQYLAEKNKIKGSVLHPQVQVDEPSFVASH